jgi:predicted adenylyl cyclase CyaB
MGRNVEIKAWVVDPHDLEARVAAVADRGPTPLVQDDTFFRCDTGRLKLRRFSDGTGELIFYRRPDHDGPKTSVYVISPAASPDTLLEALTLAYGQVGRVFKQRTLYLVGRTRVHLDRVERLGDLMELEVVLADGESEDAGVRDARALMARLGIAADQLVEGAYVDLLRRHTTDAGSSSRSEGP